MFEIKVNVNAPELSEALNNLALAIYSLTQVKEVPAGESEPSETIQPNAAETENAAEVEQQATQSTAADVQPEPEKASPQRTVTLDELSRAGAALIDAGKMPDLINLLGEYNVQAITQLKPGDYPIFAERLEALGAKF